jgi:hypothetical protein
MALQTRWKQLELTSADIIRDANERGVKITKTSLSAYRKHQKNMTQEQIIFLCLRYGVPVLLTVGQPVIIENKITGYEIPKYNEVECLERLKKYEHIYKK